MTAVTLPDVLQAHSATLERLDSRTLSDGELAEMFARQAKCQSLHNEPDNAQCSTEITHRVKYLCGARGGGVLVCFRAAQAATSWLYANRNRRNVPVLDDDDGKGFICEDCRRSLEDCWVVLPV